MSSKQEAKELYDSLKESGNLNQFCRRRMKGNWEKDEANFLKECQEIQDILNDAEEGGFE